MRLRHLLVLAPLALPFACAKTDPAPGELMLAVQTDMHAPKDVDAVGIYVAERDPTTQHDTIIFGFAERVAPDGTVHFPATLAVVGRKNPGAIVRVRAVAFRGNQARIVRDAVTTIPTDRAALLRLPLRWIDDNGKSSGTFSADGALGGASIDLGAHPLAGSAATIDDGFLQITSGCADDESEINGACAKSTIDSTTLPDYSDALVFGGGTPDGGGTCFNVAKCFGGFHKLDLDLATCSAPAPAEAMFDLAVATPVGDKGDCTADACYVPLDKDTPEGWTLQNGRVVLPAAYCARIQSGDAIGVVDDGNVPGCAPKANDAPLCGPASTIGPGSGVESDAGVADGSHLDGAIEGGQEGGADGGTFSVDNIPTPLQMAHDAANLYVVTLGGKVLRIPKSGGAPVQLADLGADGGGFPQSTTDAQMVLVGNYLVIGEPLSTVLYVVPTAGGAVITDGTSMFGGSLKLLGRSGSQLAYVESTTLIRNCVPGTAGACSSTQTYLGQIPSGVNPVPSQMATDPTTGNVYVVGATQKATDIEVWRQNSPTFDTAVRGPIRSNPMLTSGGLALDNANAYYIQAETQGNILFAVKTNASTPGTPYLTVPEDLSAPAGEPGQGLALDEPAYGHIFWTNAAGDLRGSRLAPASPVTLVTGQHARQIYADGTYVYYTVFTKPLGAVHRVAWASFVGP